MEASAGAWLALQCEAIPGVARGVLIMGEPGSPDAKPIATWPTDAAVPAELIKAARAALDRDRVVLNGRPRAEKGLASVAVPVLPGASGPAGTVALELGVSTSADTSAVAERLRSGASWLEAPATGDQSARRLGSVLRLVGTCLESNGYRAAAVAVATELATHLRCERVSIGFLQAGQIRVEALSHSAHFDARTQLVRDLAAAMEEATDQDEELARLGRVLDARPGADTEHGEAGG